MTEDVKPASGPRIENTCVASMPPKSSRRSNYIADAAASILGHPPSPLMANSGRGARPRPQVSTSFRLYTCPSPRLGTGPERARLAGIESEADSLVGRSGVMRGPDPCIHVARTAPRCGEAWMAGTSPAMTIE